jgi:toxin ParE1/3/4
MIYSIGVSEEAQLDIADAIQWYEQVREGLGLDFELCVFGLLNEIRRNPLLFQIRYNLVRIAFTQRFSHGIHFIVSENNVIVLGVYHSSQSPINWYDRLNKPN